MHPAEHAIGVAFSPGAVPRCTAGRWEDELITEVTKVVCYVVHDAHLLVITHDTIPLTITGVQVPAGSLEAGETPQQAAVRELGEETGLHGEVRRLLGVQRYNLRPTRQEIAVRHFALMRVDGARIGDRWTAGETTPSNGGTPVTWTCWWMPLRQGHVLSAGLGAMLAQV